MVVFMALKYKWKRKRASATGEFAIGDLDNSSDDEYGAACPFDLSLRIEALTLEKQSWSVHARAIATPILTPYYVVGPACVVHPCAAATLATLGVYRRACFSSRCGGLSEPPRLLAGW